MTHAQPSPSADDLNLRWPDPAVRAMTADARRGATYQIHVKLEGTEPPVWRRFLVPGDYTLDRLHDIVQIVMGWRDSHLHDFEIGGHWFSEVAQQEETDEDEKDADESEFRLCQLFPDAPQEFSYEYDFGDGWSHTLVVEAILPPAAAGLVPELICLEGAGACPPEGSGGAESYVEMLRAFADSAHPRHKEAVAFLGPAFDPRAISLQAVNDELSKYRRWRRRRSLDIEDEAAANA